jgi:Flp pilus assembly protein TadB
MRATVSVTRFADHMTKSKNAHNSWLHALVTAVLLLVVVVLVVVVVVVVVVVLFSLLLLLFILCLRMNAVRRLVRWRRPVMVARASCNCQAACLSAGMLSLQTAGRLLI